MRQKASTDGAPGNRHAMPMIAMGIPGTAVLID
jgi:hypothetical protein